MGTSSCAAGRCTVSRRRACPRRSCVARRPVHRGCGRGSGHFWRVLVRPAGDGRHVVDRLQPRRAGRTVTRLEIADTAAGAVAIVLLAAIGLPLVRVSLAPLARIEDTAAAIAAGDLSRRIDHPSSDTEVGRLAGALNTMLGRIEAAYRARAEGEARAL